MAGHFRIRGLQAGAGFAPRVRRGWLEPAHRGGPPATPRKRGQVRAARPARLRPMEELAGKLAGGAAEKLHEMAKEATANEVRL